MCGPDGFRWELGESTPFVLLVAKAVRTASGVRVAMLLAESGFVAESASLLRMVSDFATEAFAVAEGELRDKRTKAQRDSVDQFFERKPTTPGATVAGRKRLYVGRDELMKAHVRLSNDVGLDGEETLYDGYIHGAYLTAMELYHGGRHEFMLFGHERHVFGLIALVAGDQTLYADIRTSLAKLEASGARTFLRQGRLMLARSATVARQTRAECIARAAVVCHSARIDPGYRARLVMVGGVRPKRRAVRPLRDTRAARPASSRVVPLSWTRMPTIQFTTPHLGTCSRRSLAFGQAVARRISGFSGGAEGLSLYPNLRGIERDPGFVDVMRTAPDGRFTDGVVPPYLSVKAPDARQFCSRGRLAHGSQADCLRDVYRGSGEDRALLHRLLRPRRQDVGRGPRALPVRPREAVARQHASHRRRGQRRCAAVLSGSRRGKNAHPMDQ